MPDMKDVIFNEACRVIGHILSLLLVIFVVFKLIKLVDWSWYVVLFPLWGTCTFVVLAIAAVLGYGYIRSLYETRKRIDE